MVQSTRIVADPFVQSIIRRKVENLVGRAGLTPQDRDDLEQELVFRLLRSLPRFDADQGNLDAFATTVLTCAAAMILRERRAKKRDSRKVRSLDDLRARYGARAEPVDPRSDAEAFDLVHDLEAVLGRLSDDQRLLAERLMTQSMSQAARDLGIPRSTLQGRVRPLREVFEDAGLKIYLYIVR